jgi:hypothetical protein
MKALQKGGDSPQAEKTDPGIEALRIAAHDLKNPLTTIKTLAQIFKINLDKGTLTTELERTARNCEILLQQVDRLALMTDILIDASRAQSGRMKFEYKSVDFRMVVQSAVAQNQSKVSECVLPDHPVKVDWDIVRMTQALSFLMSFGKSIRVVTGLAADGSGVTIALSGEFDPAAQKHEDPRLYIAQMIIKKHSGLISNQFEIKIPVTPPASF